MQKINIIGTSSTGKSTFAKALAEKLGYHYIELDRLHWCDNWKEASDDAFWQAIEAQMSAHSRWVMDGNYSINRAIRWREVDTVIWLNYTLHVVLYRAIKRVMTRIIKREKLWGTNNVESLRQLFSKDSIVWLTLTTYHKKRKQYPELMNNPDYQHINFIEFTSPRSARDFLKNLHR